MNSIRAGFHLYIHTYIHPYTHTLHTFEIFSFIIHEPSPAFFESFICALSPCCVALRCEYLDLDLDLGRRRRRLGIHPTHLHSIIHFTRKSIPLPSLCITTLSLLLQQPIPAPTQPSRLSISKPVLVCILLARSI